VGTVTCVLLNSEEVLDAVPWAAHDRRGVAAAKEAGLLRFPVPKR
jgi:hypothetical protein